VRKVSVLLLSPKITIHYPRTRGIALSALFATLLSIFSVISLPIPVSPVPITLQVLVVFLIVTLLGPYFGAFACVVYLLFGSIGLPVFAGASGGPGVLFGPLGGYLVAFPLCALVGGSIARNRASSKKIDALRVVIATVVSLAIIYSIGVVWLAESLKLNLVQGFEVGAVPFIPVDVAKAVFAVPMSMYFRWARADLPVNNNQKISQRLKN
jgi:biotin transport system substrate-specific component